MNSKGLLKRLSAFLTAAACAVGLIGGSGGAFFNAQISAGAVDEGAQKTSQLAPGEYTLNISRQLSVTDTTSLWTYPEHICGKALLTIGEDYSQKITIGVEHWSLYDAFIPAKQSCNSTEFTAIPSAVFNLDNEALTNFGTYYNDNSENITDDANSWYNYSNDENNKFGDISFDLDSTFDTAYVSFEIDDFTESFSVFGWFNVPVDGNRTRKIEPGNKYYDLITYNLDVSSLSSVDNMTEGNISHNVLNGTDRVRDIPTAKTNRFNGRIEIRHTGSYDYMLIYVKLYINQFMLRSIKCRVSIRNAVIQHDSHHLS